MEPLLAKRLRVQAGLRPRHDFESEGRALVERIGERGDLLGRRVIQSLGPRRKFHVAQRLRVGAARDKPAEERERRGRGLCDQVADRLPEDLAILEVGVVEVAADRQVDVDLAAAVAQQAERELQRQLCRVGALDRLSEVKLVELEFVLATNIFRTRETMSVASPAIKAN
jgi:hypothetical protein